MPTTNKDEPITIHNDGPRLTGTDYWQTEHAARGLVYLSINAGAFRVLVPPVESHILQEIASAKDVVISRGPWPAAQLADAIEILWDDGSDTPYALHLSPEAVDRLPLDTDAGSRWRCVVYTVDAEGTTVERGSWPATYRRSPRLPDLRPSQP